MSTTNDQMIAGYDYKEWVRLESLFLKDYENSTRYNKPFSALISDVLENESVFQRGRGAERAAERKRERTDSPQHRPKRRKALFRSEFQMIHLLHK